MKTPVAYAKQHSARFVSELQQLVRFPSVSAQPQHTRDVRACANWVAKHFRDLGLQVTVHETPRHPIIEARTVAALAKRGPAGRRAYQARQQQPTVLIYGHYDVQPPEPLELWKTPPFEPVIRGGKLFGRGSSDNKGQFFAHVKAVESYLRTGTLLPVNVIFLIEGEEEVGSRNLFTFVAKHSRRLRADYVVISDTSMFSPQHPTLTYGTRGIVGCEVRVDGPARDLHSGVFGGSVANPALVLSRLLATCVDADGRVSIPGFYDGVKPLAAWERREWRRLPFDEPAYRRMIGAPQLTGEKGYTTLERRWVRPTFEINGLTSGYQGPGGKTIVPAWAVAKITCRVVPGQNPPAVLRAIHRHLRRHCPKSVRLTLTGSCSSPFFTSPDGPGAKAALAALEAAFGKKPVRTREGGTLPILDIFHRHLHAEILMLGLGLADDNWHSPNEKFDLGNFQNGIVMSVALLRNLGGEIL